MEFIMSIKQRKLLLFKKGFPGYYLNIVNNIRRQYKMNSAFIRNNKLLIN